MCLKIEDLKRFTEEQAKNYFEMIKEEIKNTHDNFIIINGKANSGKTTIANKLAEHFSYNENLRTLYFSLETSKSTLEEKIRCSENLVIYDKPINISEMISKINELKAEFVVIDYLQLIKFVKENCLSRNKELELIKYDLRNLSDKLNIKIVVTSYVS